MCTCEANSMVISSTDHTDHWKEKISLQLYKMYFDKEFLDNTQID